jgi:hypothetical protein
VFILWVLVRQWSSLELTRNGSSFAQHLPASLASIDELATDAMAIIRQGRNSAANVPGPNDYTDKKGAPIRQSLCNSQHFHRVSRLRPMVPSGFVPVRHPPKIPNRPVIIRGLGPSEGEGNAPSLPGRCGASSLPALPRQQLLSKS